MSVNSQHATQEVPKSSTIKRMEFEDDEAAEVLLNIKHTNREAGIDAKEKRECSCATTLPIHTATLLHVPAHVSLVWRNVGSAGTFQIPELFRAWMMRHSRQKPPLDHWDLTPGSESKLRAQDCLTRIPSQSTLERVWDGRIGPAKLSYQRKRIVASVLKLYGHVCVAVREPSQRRKGPQTRATPRFLVSLEALLLSVCRASRRHETFEQVVKTLGRLWFQPSESDIALIHEFAKCNSLL